ncbi:MAG TPA: polysaccharide biosynthesis/export family protein [Longimicrobiaceae bacterium]
MPRRLLVLLAALVLAPCAARAQAADTAGPVLQPGDSIRIAVFRREELSGRWAVGADGRVAHPLYRAVAVAGVPPAEVEARVRAFLQRFGADPQFVVEPVVRVAVAGEARQPRLFWLTPGISVAQAVALAGGPAERADLRRSKLIRGGQEMALDLSRPDQGLAATQVRSGDQIVVARRPAGAGSLIAPVASVAAALVGIVNILVR